MAMGLSRVRPTRRHDPYSASKAGTELVVQSYRRSFLAEKGVLIASARAGNVIGGGDYSEDRLIPDAARAAESGQTLLIRSPQATRPWQHVLEPLNGYLLLAERLLSGDVACAEAFNFGPEPEGNVSVREILARLQNYWPELAWQVDTLAAQNAPHEAGFLYLDSAKAVVCLAGNRDGIWIRAWKKRQLGIAQQPKMLPDCLH